MAKIIIGTAGWDYKDWIGPFYPKNLEKSNKLEHFSQFFEIVEVNSTFYNLPSKKMVINWYNRVPQNFRFIVKVWQKISHNLSDPNLHSYITDFFSVIESLKEKLEGILIQFPPWFKYSEEHLSQLKSLLNKIPKKHKYFIELRDNSWFHLDILKSFINGNSRILGTTYMPNVVPFYLPNQTNYYIRLIGDRELTVFNRIQREQTKSLKNLYENLKLLDMITNIYEIFIIVNNHFAGFAPETVNEIKKLLGLPLQRYNSQKSLFDYIK
jgi:uncharacterized protein YecE (DUF72 family)